MSIATMTRWEQEAVGATTIASGDAVKNALAAVAGYIPSEALALYVALVSLYGPPEATLKWLLFGVGAAAVCFFAWAGYGMPLVRPSGSRRPWIVLAIALVAFTAYAAALPDGPFLALNGEAAHVATGVVIILAAALPVLTKRFNLRA